MKDVIPFTIDAARSYQHLSRAPIIEAGIEMRSQYATKFTKESAQPSFEKNLGKYKYKDSLHLELSKFRERNQKLRLEMILNGRDFGMNRKIGAILFSLKKTASFSAN